jgi:hypothetical protein
MFGASDPEDAVEDLPMVTGGSAGPGFLRWEEGLDQGPLLVGEVMARHGNALYLTQYQLSKQTLAAPRQLHALPSIQFRNADLDGLLPGPRIYGDWLRTLASAVRLTAIRRR